MTLIRHLYPLRESLGEFESWNPKQINPALLTTQEYSEIANSGGKWHPENAYDLTLEKLNAYGANKKDYRLVRRFRINGLSFELMVKQEPRSYAVRNPDPEATDGWLRDEEGKVLMYTREEQDRLGLRPYEWTVAIFHEDSRVAAAQDEWGCMLVMVAREYRALGLGTILGKAARTLEPSKDSGGFTPSGFNNFARVHREFVRDALTSGLYRSLIKSGQITTERVKEIIGSIDLSKRQKPSSLNLDSSNPINWLLYHQYGTFILYDRGLIDLIKEGERFDHFADRMVKGLVYAMVDDRVGVARIKQFGGETQKIKAFMLALAHTYAQLNDVTLVVEPSEYDFPNFEYGEESRAAGYSSKEIIGGPKINYAAMVEQEERFRKNNDQYDEFLHALMDYAHRIHG